MFCSRTQPGAGVFKLGPLDSEYTTQNLISIKVLFSIQLSVNHPGFDPNLMKSPKRKNDSLICVRECLEATD